MDKKGPITGTFIDEITFNMPAQNWSSDEWRKDFDHMQEIGIDTMILIRGGFDGKTIFPSKIIGTLKTSDFAGFVLEEASLRNMNVFFGLYCSNLTWNNGDYIEETRINKRFVDEVYERYGHYPALGGWYIPQEVGCDEWNIKDTMRNLSILCKDKTPDKKVLISPYFQAHDMCQKKFTPEQHYEEWDRIFDYIGKEIDICAFQDGTAQYKMREFFLSTRKLCEKYNIAHWVNVETFERDPFHKGYPISFEILRQRLEMHEEYAEKMITFEFSHFLSPQSMFPTAQNLNKLYKNYFFK